MFCVIFQLDSSLQVGVKKWDREGERVEEDENLEKSGLPTNIRSLARSVAAKTTWSIAWRSGNYDGRAVGRCD